MSGAIGAKEEEFGGLNQKTKRAPFHETVRATSIDGIRTQRVDNIDPSVLARTGTNDTKFKAVADPFGLRQSLDASPKDVRVRMLPYTRSFTMFSSTRVWLLLAVKRCCSTTGTMLCQVATLY